MTVITFKLWFFFFRQLAYLWTNRWPEKAAIFPSTYGGSWGSQCLSSFILDKKLITYSDVKMLIIVYSLSLFWIATMLTACQLTYNFCLLNAHQHILINAIWSVWLFSFHHWRLFFLSFFFQMSCFHEQYFSPVSFFEQIVTNQSLCEQ